MRNLLWIIPVFFVALIGGTQTNGHFGAAHMAAAEIAPVYNTSGTLQSNAHQVIGSGTATGTALVVTLSGSAIFTSSSSYGCVVDDQGSLPVAITYTSGSSFTITDAGTGNVMRYVCTGN